MVYHILNGDSLAVCFPEANIAGEIIVVREALIDGSVSGDNLYAIWESRTKYLGIPEKEYYQNVVKEFEKINNAPDNSEFNLWFEYDLFCQVNMWFVLSIINNMSITKKVYAVYTSHLDQNSNQFWNGFGRATSNDLRICLANRTSLEVVDVRFGQYLWNAYKAQNLEALIRLSKDPAPAFPYLREVVQAHVDRFPKDGSKGRPERVIEEIIKNGTTDFHKVFEKFWRRESIYGFGDVQMKKLYDKVMQSLGNW
jgi:hypothetical protein